MESFLEIDPTTLTVSRLKAILSEEGVELPTTKEPKSTYVELFHEHKAKLLELKHKSEEPQSPPETPRKRKQRHSINVFQSGAKKLVGDEEEQQKKPKKRKSLNTESVQPTVPSKQPSSSSTHSQIHYTHSFAPPDNQSYQPHQLQPHQLQPHQPQPHQPQFQQPQHHKFQQAHHNPMQTSLSSNQPVTSLHSRTSLQLQPSTLRKYQLPPTLFQPQSKVISKQSTYISPLYFSTPPSVPQPIARQSQPSYSTHSNTKPLSPSQLPLPPPPSPLPTPTQPLPPLPPPPSPLSAQQLANLSTSTRKPQFSIKPKSRGILPYLYVFLVFSLWMIALVCLYSSMTAYFEETPRFCNTTDLSADSCVPCPPNGSCEDGKLECAPRYVRSGMKCIQDLELELMVNSISERINEIVMAAGGRHQCNPTFEKEYVTIDELKNELKGAYPAKKFDEAFVAALRDITTSRRYEHLRAENTSLVSTKVMLSLPCMAKLALYEQLPFLSLLATGVTVALTIRFWRECTARKTKDVNIIVAMVLSDLQAKKESEEGSGGDRGIVVDHLRDKLLHGRSDRYKRDIWARVQAVVQADSRVVEYASFKHGAQVTNWEWAAK